MRVLHLTAGSDAGGVSRYLLDLCQAMHDAGHTVAVAGERGAWHESFAAAPWPWIDVPLKGHPLALWSAARTLRRWLTRHPVDLIHTHSRRASLVARRLQRDGPVPILYTVHLSDMPMNWLRKRWTDFGDHTHVAAKETRDWVRRQGVPDDRITLIHHGIHADRFPLTTPDLRHLARDALGLRADDVVAAYVGRLDDPKNERWLIDLAIAARDQVPNLKILITGDGPHEPRLHRLVEDRHLIEIVRLLGHRDPLPIYQAADALLLPSAREGFGYACAEAMSTGLPVLRTRTAGTAAMILENRTGRSVPIDRTAFIRSSIEFLQNPEDLRRMGQTAAGHIRAHLLFERQLDQTVELYRRLCTLPGPADPQPGPVSLGAGA